MLRENDDNSFASTRPRTAFGEQAPVLFDPVSLLILDDRQLVLESVAALMRSRIDDAEIVARSDLAALDFDPTLVVILERFCSRVALEAIGQHVRRWSLRSQLVALLHEEARDAVAVATARGVRCIHDLSSLQRLVRLAGRQRSGARHLDERLEAPILDAPMRHDSLEDQASPSSTFQRLTPREQEILERLDRGLPNKIIAYELGISCCTVKVHIRNILQKFKARNRTQAAFIARQRLVEAAVRS